MLRDRVYRGKLGGSGERIKLQRPDSPPLLEPDFVPHLIEDEVEYDDIAPGPIGPDGNGDSLHRVHFEVFGGYGGSWRPDAPNPGTASDFSMPPIVVTPVANVLVDEDSAPSVRDVSATFEDPDPGDTLTLSVSVNTNPGLVTTDLTAGILTLSYVPGINGTANIAVRATDPIGAWVEETITVTVAFVNDAPPTVVDAVSDVAVDEDAADSIVHLWNVFDDVDFGDTLALSVTGNANPGLVVTSIFGTRLALSYAPDENGTSDITVRATDSGGIWVEDTFSVTVDPVNDAPTVASPIDDVAVDEDAADTVIDMSNVFDDIDFGDTLSLSVSDNSNTGLVTAGAVGMNLTLSFVADQNGTADITIRAADSGVPGLWVEDTFTVTVDPVNDAPVMDELPDRSLDEDTRPGSVISLWRYVSDVEDLDTRLTFSITGNTNPDCGVSIFSDRAFDIVPTPNWNGYSDVTIEVQDLDGATDSGTFRITINPVNDEPTVAAPIDDVAVDEDAGDTVLDLSSVFDDVDLGDSLALSITGNTNPGLVTTSLVDDELTLSYAPDGNGDASITVRGMDSEGAFVTDTFTVTVNPVNDAPTVSDPIDDVAAFENDPDTVLNLLGAFADVDIGDNLTLSVFDNTNPGLVTADLVGTQLTLSYLPDQSGTAEITVRATDSGAPGLEVEDTFTVTVNPDNFPPIVANPISDITVDAGGGDTVMHLSDVFADNFGVAPALDYTAIEIDPATGAPSAGSGLFQYKFTLYGHDGADASFAITSLTFSGNIQQSTFNWNNADYPAHDEGFADIFHNPPDYNKHLDTWRYSGWTNIAPGDSNLPPANIFAPGPQDGEDVIVSAGSGTDVFCEQKDVVQIVAFGDVAWSGQFARQQVSYNTSGIADGNRLTLSVEGNTNPGLLTASMLGSQLTLAYVPGAGGSAEVTIRATDPDGAWVEETFTVDVTGGSSAEVVGRHIFYNNSALDAGGDDDAAIDPVKTPLLPQGAASSDNYTSYSRGINGIMVDIDGLAGTPTVGDIGVRVNQAAAPDTWSTGPAPESVTVRAGQGVGGSDRVTIVWADGAILNQWVEVTVLSGANTGLGAADVFYAGNIVGDSNDDGRIDAGDLTALVSEFGMRGGAELTADVNIDGRVNLTDVAIMRSSFGTSLGLPTMPSAAPPAAAPPAAAAAPVAEANVDILAESATSSEEDAIVGGDAPLGLPPVSVEIAPINLPAPAPILGLAGSDDLLLEEGILTLDDGLDAVLDADDLLVDMLAESALVAGL